MMYASGDRVELGDTVDLGASQRGIVVGIIGDGRYADGYRREDWSYLTSGLLIATEFGDLRLDAPDEDLELIARSKTQRSVVA